MFLCQRQFLNLLLASHEGCFYTIVRTRSDKMHFKVVFRYFNRDMWYVPLTTDLTLICWNPSACHLRMSSLQGRICVFMHIIRFKPIWLIQFIDSKTCLNLVCKFFLNLVMMKSKHNIQRGVMIHKIWPWNAFCPTLCAQWCIYTTQKNCGVSNRCD